MELVVLDVEGREKRRIPRVLTIEWNNERKSSMCVTTELDAIGENDEIAASARTAGLLAMTTSG